jgi:hypothetical protein
MYLGVDPPALHYILESNHYQEHYLIIFEFLIIISLISLYPYIVRAIHAYLTTPATKAFFDFFEFEISDPWHYLTVKEYIKDIPKYSWGDTDGFDYQPKQFDIIWKWADDSIGHYYRSAGKPIQCIILKKQ